MSEKEHICARMVQIIESAGFTVAEWEADASEAGLRVSGGYLRKAAKNNINIGIDLVEYFLAQFPDVNPAWLIKGEGLSRDTDKNITPATKSEAGVKQALEGTIRILREENLKLLNIVELALKRGGADGA